jgi:RNA polymerase sigma-70 factor (ECF subfamily)
MNGNETAKDVVQDVFTKLWEKHEQVQFDKVKSYLFTAGYHTMIDAFRRNSIATSIEEVASANHAHEQHYSDLSEILDDAIKNLPENQRAAVLLRDYEGYSYREIGDMLQFSETQVKVYIYRARKFLQQYLKSVETVL